MTRVSSLSQYAALLGSSAALHAVVFFAPIGHDVTSPAAGDEAVFDVITDLTLRDDATKPEPVHAEPIGEREPARIARATVASRGAPPLARVAPLPSDAARLASMQTADDATPRFTIAIGGGSDQANGAVSSSDAAPPLEGPFLEPSVDERARLMRGRAPAYPDAARAAGIEGDVRLEIVVSASGAVESARVTQGIGHGLDDAALAAARQYQFTPAFKGGRRVRVRMPWSMRFRLQ